jgi:hypothetical protein
MPLWSQVRDIAGEDAPALRQALKQLAHDKVPSGQPGDGGAAPGGYPAASGDGSIGALGNGSVSNGTSNSAAAESDASSDSALAMQPKADMTFADGKTLPGDAGGSGDSGLICRTCATSSSDAGVKLGEGSSGSTTSGDSNPAATNGVSGMAPSAELLGTATAAAGSDSGGGSSSDDDHDHSPPPVPAGRLTARTRSRSLPSAKISRTDRALGVRADDPHWQALGSKGRRLLRGERLVHALISRAQVCRTARPRPRPTTPPNKQTKKTHKPTKVPSDRTANKPNPRRFASLDPPAVVLKRSLLRLQLKNVAATFAKPTKRL